MARVLIKDSSQLTHKFPNDLNNSSQDSSIFFLQELSFFWATKAPQEGSQDNSKTTLNQLNVALFLPKIAQKIAPN